MSLQPSPKQDFFLFPVTDLGSSIAKSVLLAMEQVGIGVAYWDFDNDMIYWSKGLAELYGLLLGWFHRTYQDYLGRVHPDDRFELKSLIERVKTTLEGEQIEYRVMVEDQERWLRSYFSPGIKDGRLTHIIELVFDISDLKSAQTALVSAETRRQKLLGSISDVLIETTFSGEVVFATDSITPLWGYLPDELRGASLLSIVEFEDSFPLDSSARMESDFLPVSVTANVLHKHYAWTTTQCNIQVDAARQTLFFMFKPSRQTGLALEASPQIRGAIASVTNALVYRYPLPSIYASVFETLASLLQADCIHLYQYHSDQQLWRNIYDYRQTPDLPCALGFEFPDQDNCISHVLKLPHPKRIECWEYSGIDPEPDFMAQFSGVWLVLPILVNAKIWGAILVICFDEGKQWTEPEFNQAIVFGDYISLAIATQHP
ncbi:PAS domain-containing protein [Oculatella sp. LEGE 06141]|uniref:PAS domain-containing protein n=1 Tax=Oculatella sp. LEGE 06141 TaxID=1828648 RepID=UPI0018818C5A|nr:GAF domain-containing protein [Oculatella sp. LEGE 06141]MBE9180078.1 PAS domain-containing protein [Oculatella sp. LEGE 06141]